jgi:very-short-patch-repair endonuclease
VLEAAKKLGATTVCPGHGPIGTGELLDEQREYFVELRKLVKKHARKSPAEMKAAVDGIKAALLQQPRIAKFVGDFFTAQVEKVYVEMGGKAFQSKQAVDEHPTQHAQAHGAEPAR